MLDNNVTIYADTVEEAIEQGLNQLGITREEAEVRIISEGKKGFLGFGKQEAVVSVSSLQRPSLSELTNELEEQESKVEKMSEELPVDEFVDIDVEGSKEEPSPEENSVKETTEKETKTSPTSKKMTETALIEEEDDDEELPYEDESKQTDEEKAQHQIELHKASRIVADFLIDIIQEYGAQADIEVEQEGNQLIFNIDTDKSGLIIGKHGKIINSLQILAQTLLHHHYRHRANVTLNVGDYRDRRAGVLEQMAQRTAEEVLKTKQPAILDSLPAYERKQIHAYLSKIEHIKTHSEGKDPNRYLVVEYVND